PNGDVDGAYAFDIAIWDIRGKVLGKPIYELLGGPVRDEIALYTHPNQAPTVVGFDSPGGNVIKAIELCRLILSLGLYTLQVRQSECASACS
ncbi:hypothetical protein ACC724_38290, partial [Rhizobium ruizarguesonis]